MLNKSNRVRKEKEYKEIFKAHKRVNSENFRLSIHLTSQEKLAEGQKLPSFGIVVSKKIGNAPTRNKVKRRIREILRLNLEKFKPTFKSVINTYPSIAELNYKQLEAEIMNAFRNGGVML